MSLFITSITSNISNISFGILHFLVLLLVVMKFILLLEVIPGVNCEILIISFSHLFFSCHKSRFFLRTFFSNPVERDQLPSCTNPLNEWVPWSRETTQGSHHNLSFFDIIFNYFKLFFDLSNPCEVRLHGLWFLYLHIFQLIPQCHILVGVLSF